MNWALAAYSFEHLEIASYKVLIATAEACDETGIADTCRENLKEEEAMASWIRDNLEGVTLKYLARDKADLEASR